MNKPVVLALLAAGIGGIGVYLLLRAHPDRMHAAVGTQAAPPRPSAGTLDAGAVPASAGGTPGTHPAATPAVQPTEPRFGSADDHRARQRRLAEEFLERYADPAQRAQLRETTLDEVRRSTAGFEQRYGLTPEQYEKLVELLADEAIEQRLTAARCITDAGCITSVFNDAVFGARDQDIRDILGDEGFKELRAFRAAETDRDVVGGLQARLAPELALTPAQADSLTHALHDERLRLRRESYSRQEHLEGWALAGGAAPRLEYADNLATPELMYQSGERYVQAMRDRAATMLTGEQLVAFNRMQDELLVSFRRRLRLGDLAAPAPDHEP
jgi:hypothetical protein